MLSTQPIQPILTKILKRTFGTVVPLEQISRSRNLAFRFMLDGEHYVIKLPTINRNAISKELMLFELAAGNDVPVPEVVSADSAGDLCGYPFLIMRSAGRLTLAEWRAGHLKATVTRDALAAAYQKMGVYLARIHGITMSHSGEIDGREFAPSDPTRFITGLFEVADQLVERSIISHHDAQIFKGAGLPPVNGSSLCHSDFRDTQCIISENAISAIVDWESAWSGNPLIDFAIASTHLELTGEAELLDAFNSGYRSLRSPGTSYPADYEIVFLATILALFKVWMNLPVPLSDARLKKRVRDAARAFRIHADRLAV